VATQLSASEAPSSLSVTWASVVSREAHVRHVVGVLVDREDQPAAVQLVHRPECRSAVDLTGDEVDVLEVVRRAIDPIVS
jgi:hypothetical protein